MNALCDAQKNTEATVLKDTLLSFIDMSLKLAVGAFRNTQKKI